MQAHQDQPHRSSYAANLETEVAMGNRLTLLLIGQVLAKLESLVASVTTEDEAIENTKRHRSSLLICEAPLES
jgi:hypothetical protein